MTIATLDEAITRFGVNVLTHLDRTVSIPTVSVIGRQGDVLILAKSSRHATTALPAAGFPAVRGEAGGNTHLLLGDGPVFYDQQPASATSLTLGVLTVPAGSMAYLAHPEHAYLGITAGTYELRRQREQSDEIRLVTD
jgi:hypothetical protein